MTITEFLVARLDEIEADAKAVKPLRVLDIWGIPHEESWSIGRASYRGEDGAAYREGDSPALVHFLRWEPAAVLAYVAAMRKIVAMARFSDDPEGKEQNCVEFWLDDERKHLSPPPVHAILIAVFSALVEQFAGHPDFQEEWRS